MIEGFGMWTTNCQNQLMECQTDGVTKITFIITIFILISVRKTFK